MAFTQGDIIVIEDPFKDGRRPAVIVSNSTHPFHGQQYMVVPLSTQARDESVKLTPDACIRGNLHHVSYANAWSILTVQAEDVVKWAGHLRADIVDTLVSNAFAYMVPHADGDCNTTRDTATDPVQPSHST